MRMRVVALAVIAVQLGLASPAFAEDSPTSDRLTGESLPLFEKNHCVDITDPADQMFCGDPELNSVGTKLSAAIQARLDRIINRRRAIVENAEWIRDRDSSCGIFGKQPIAHQYFKPVKECLLKETEERIAILADPNFDCLVANTAAATLICSDPSLAIAETELNNEALALITKLGGDDAQRAFAEYGLWIRARDRKCDIAGKENVPLEELLPAEVCLAAYMREKTAEIVAAKGDPKSVFGWKSLSPSPDADAVDLCVAQIHFANACRNFVSVNRIVEIDRDVEERNARVLAEVEMVVLSPFSLCSPIASVCTGTCWDPVSGKPKGSQPGLDNLRTSRNTFAVAHRVRIEKSFEFQKADGGWRCGSTALQPIELGIALGIGP
jgi:uncharacterized protein YecT (DUF1311 family)